MIRMHFCLVAHTSKQRGCRKYGKYIGGFSLSTFFDPRMVYMVYGQSCTKGIMGMNHQKEPGIIYVGLGRSIPEPILGSSSVLRSLISVPGMTGSTAFGFI
jgi:hypothetical protein